MLGKGGDSVCPSVLVCVRPQERRDQGATRLVMHQKKALEGSRKALLGDPVSVILVTVYLPFMKFVGCLKLRLDIAKGQPIDGNILSFKAETPP